MKKLPFFILACLLISACVHNQNTKTMKSGDYIGETPPDSIAKIFAPNFISTHLHERDFAITPDGKEYYYTVWGRDYYAIAVTKQVNGEWTEPAIAPFSGNKKYRDLEPFISKDGAHFYFMSTRPPKGKEEKDGWFYQNIWVMDRIENGWSEPYELGEPVNSDAGEYFPSLTNDGTIYFTREDGEGQQSIYRSKMIDGKYQKAERLPEEVNASRMQYNSMIAPDESYIIVCTKLEGNTIGRTDYCISFNLGKNKWTPLINMGSKVNFPNCHALSPSLSADGKYFIFSSNKQSDTDRTKLDLNLLKEQALSPQNGNLDLYWIKSDFIEDIRKDYFANH